MWCVKRRILCDVKFHLGGEAFCSRFGRRSASACERRFADVESWSDGAPRDSVACNLLVEMASVNVPLRVINIVYNTLADRCC